MKKKKQRIKNQEKWINESNKLNERETIKRKKNLKKEVIKIKKKKKETN